MCVHSVSTHPSVPFSCPQWLLLSNMLCFQAVQPPLLLTGVCLVSLLESVVWSWHAHVCLCLCAHVDVCVHSALAPDYYFHSVASGSSFTFRLLCVTEKHSFNLLMRIVIHSFHSFIQEGELRLTQFPLCPGYGSGWPLPGFSRMATPAQPVPSMPPAALWVPVSLTHETFVPQLPDTQAVASRRLGSSRVPVRLHDVDAFAFVSA